MKKLALMAFVVLSAGLMTSRAEVRVSVNFGPGYCAPRPVYCAPRVYYRPAPIYCEPPVVVYQRPRRVIVVDDDCHGGYYEDRRVVYQERPVVYRQGPSFYDERHRQNYQEVRTVYARPGW